MPDPSSNVTGFSPPIVVWLRAFKGLSGSARGMKPMVDVSSQSSAPAVALIWVNNHNHNHNNAFFALSDPAASTLSSGSAGAVGSSPFARKALGAWAAAPREAREAFSRFLAAAKEALGGDMGSAELSEAASLVFDALLSAAGEAARAGGDGESGDGWAKLSSPEGTAALRAARAGLTARLQAAVAEEPLRAAAVAAAQLVRWQAQLASPTAPAPSLRVAASSFVPPASPPPPAPAPPPAHPRSRAMAPLASGGASALAAPSGSSSHDGGWADHGGEYGAHLSFSHLSSSALRADAGGQSALLEDGEVDEAEGGCWWEEAGPTEDEMVLFFGGAGGGAPASLWASLSSASGNVSDTSTCFDAAPTAVIVTAAATSAPGGATGAAPSRGPAPGPMVSTARSAEGSKGSSLTTTAPTSLTTSTGAGVPAPRGGPSAAPSTACTSAPAAPSVKLTDRGSFTAAAAALHATQVSPRRLSHARPTSFGRSATCGPSCHPGEPQQGAPPEGDVFGPNFFSSQA